MKGPDSRCSILAPVFCILGAALLLCGLLIPVLQIALPWGEAWMFLLAGGGLLLAGIACIQVNRRRKKQRAQLIAAGQAVLGSTVSTSQHLYTCVGVDRRGLHIRSPWTLECEYTWAGRTYTVRSPLLWGRPRESQPITVYLDPKRPDRAVIDVDSVHFVR